MQLKEWRIYLIGADLFPIDGKEHNQLSNYEFMTIAENEGNVSSLQGFADNFNNDYVNTESFMRIIEVSLEDPKTVKCNGCDFVGYEEDLITTEDKEGTKQMQENGINDREFMRACPNCLTDENLMDIEEPKN
jgi:hypothetical protein